MVALLEKFFESLSEQTKNFLSLEIISHFQNFDTYIKNSFFLPILLDNNEGRTNTIDTGFSSSLKYLIPNSFFSINTSDTTSTNITSFPSATDIQNINVVGVRIDWSLISSHALASCKHQDLSVLSGNTDLLDLGSVNALSEIIFHECDARRYVHCIILCSAIESLLARVTVPGNERQILRQILQSLSANKSFPKSMEAILDAVFLPTGFNIRNLLWHGFLTDSEYSSSMLLLLICLFEKLRCLLKAENATRKSIKDRLLSSEMVNTDITAEWKMKLQMVYKKLMPSTDSTGDDDDDGTRCLLRVFNQRRVSSLVRHCCLMSESMKAIIQSALSDYFHAPNSTDSDSDSTPSPSSSDLVLSMLKILPTLEHMLRILFSIVNPHCGMFAIASKGDYFTTLDGFGQRMKHQLLLSPSLLSSSTASTPLSAPPVTNNSGTTSSTTASQVHQRDNNLPSALGSGLYALLVDLFMTDDGLNARAKLAHGYQLFNRFLDFEGPVSENLLSLGPRFDASIRREYQMLCEVLILIIIQLCLQFPEGGHNCRQLARYVAGDDTYIEGSLLRPDDSDNIIISAIVAVEVIGDVDVDTAAIITVEEVREMSAFTSAALSCYESAFHPLVKMKKTIDMTMARFHAYSSYMGSYKRLSIDIDSQSSDVATVAVEYFPSTSCCDTSNECVWVRFTDKVEKIMDYLPHYRNDRPDNLWNLSQRIVTQCLQLCNVLQESSSANLPLCRSLYESIADRISFCCDHLQVEDSPALQLPHQTAAPINKELLGMDEEGLLVDRITRDILSLYSKKPILKVSCLLQLLEVRLGHPSLINFKKTSYNFTLGYMIYS